MSSLNHKVFDVVQARLALPVLLVTAAVSPPLLLAPAEAQQAKDFASRPRGTPAWQARICPFSPDVDRVSTPVTTPMLACALRQGKSAAVLLCALSGQFVCIHPKLRDAQGLAQAAPMVAAVLNSCLALF